MPARRRSPALSGHDGNERRRIAGNPGRQSSQFRLKSRGPTIVIIDRPAGWIPASELDAPRRGRVMEFVREPVSDPPTFIRQFNAASLDAGGKLWAALAAESARVGRMVKLIRSCPQDS
jgi:hypothetical protein